MAWEHALVKDSADEDAGIFNAIDDDVFFMLHAPIAGPNRVACPAHLRRLCDACEAGEYAVKIAGGLLLAPDVHCVVGDLNQVEAGEFGEAVFRQPTAPLPEPVCGFAREFR